MSWISTTTIYQIYPRSFFDSNADGIGDLQGIIQKLDYIQALGFETIWISPFYTSPQVDFGYDIADYKNIAPEYGTMEDAIQLIAECHKRNLKIVLDMVMNHTSDQHPWFLESKQNKTNAKADWYIWKDKPNNWKSIVGPKGWQYCKERNQYFFTSFLPFQPDLNYRNETVKQTMFDICRFWLQKGVDGFRLDIFNCIIKEKEFKNNPFSLTHIIPSEEYPGGNFQYRKYTLNQDENFVLAKELRAVIDEFNPLRLLLGEVFGTHEKKKQFLGNHDGLHLVFLFDILYFKFNASFFRKKIAEFEQEYPIPFLPTIVFSNHDQFRSIKRVDNSVEKAKILAFLKFTMRAVPTIYYGEEIGMQNSIIPIKDAQDTLAKTFSWVPQFIANILPIPINRDACRTPMQWNATSNAGFSDAQKTWLPIHQHFETCNVETLQQDENSIYYVYQMLLKIRKENKELHLGNIRLIDVENNKILAYERSVESSKMLIIINFSKKEQIIKIPIEYKNALLIYALKKSSNERSKIAGLNAIILKKK
jgi:alpha-glucosidase